jgi:hypothetical protein
VEKTLMQAGYRYQIAYIVIAHYQPSSRSDGLLLDGHKSRTPAVCQSKWGRVPDYKSNNPLDTFKSTQKPHMDPKQNTNGIVQFSFSLESIKDPTLYMYM